MEAFKLLLILVLFGTFMVSKEVVSKAAVFMAVVYTGWTVPIGSVHWW